MLSAVVSGKALDPPPPLPPPIVGFLPADCSVASSVRSLVSGLWSLVSGLWSLVPRPWSLVSGLWSLVSGFWFLVSGLWSLVSGLFATAATSVWAPLGGYVPIPYPFKKIIRWSPISKRLCTFNIVQLSNKYLCISANEVSPD